MLHLLLYISFPSPRIISLRSCDFFYYEMVLEAKIWVPRMLVAAGVSLLLGLQGLQDFKIMKYGYCIHLSVCNEAYGWPNKGFQ